MKFDERVLDQTIQVWGKDYMLTLGMEEFAEVVQAINFNRRYPGTEAAQETLHEEIADCLIIIEEFKRLGIINEEAIQEWIDTKQRRQNKRNFQAVMDLEGVD